MKISEALRHAEGLLEQVSAVGLDNWNRMSDSVRIIRAVRQQIEKQEQEAEKQHGSGEDGIGQRNPEDTAGAV